MARGLFLQKSCEEMGAAMWWQEPVNPPYETDNNAAAQAQHQRVPHARNLAPALRVMLQCLDHRGGRWLVLIVLQALHHVIIDSVYFEWP
jgi:hypothetical protein